MNQESAEPRLLWPLWAAAGLAAIGGVLPFVFGGSTSRIDAVIVPFWAAAIALALCTVLHSQGRAVAYSLYFVAGLAIVYGLLSMVSLPVRFAALGSCPALPAPCTSGLPRPLTDGENNGMGAASAFGIVAILLGFYGLITLFRRPMAAPAAPRARVIPAVAPATPVAAKAVAEEEQELPAHEEAELPELPAHESSAASS